MFIDTKELLKVVVRELVRQNTLPVVARELESSIITFIDSYDPPGGKALDAIARRTMKTFVKNRMSSILQELIDG